MAAERNKCRLKSNPCNQKTNYLLLPVIPTDWHFIWHIFWHSVWHSVWNFIWQFIWQYILTYTSTVIFRHFASLSAVKFLKSIRIVFGPGEAQRACDRHLAGGQQCSPFPFSWLRHIIRTYQHPPKKKHAAKRIYAGLLGSDGGLVHHLEPTRNLQIPFLTQKGQFRNEHLTNKKQQEKSKKGLHTITKKSAHRKGSKMERSSTRILWDLGWLEVQNPSIIPFYWLVYRDSMGFCRLDYWRYRNPPYIG